MGELVAAIATVATLGYLALQIRHTIQESRAASRYALSQSYIDVLVHISRDLETTKLSRRGFIDPESLDDDETLRFDCMMMAVFQNFEVSFEQRRRNVLTDDDWEKWVIIIKQYMAQPGVQLFWSRTAVAFNPTFRRYVEELGSKEVYSYAYGQPAA